MIVIDKKGCPLSRSILMSRHPDNPNPVKTIRDWVVTISYAVTVFLLDTATLYTTRPKPILLMASAIL